MMGVKGMSEERQDKKIPLVKAGAFTPIIIFDL
jgi:hypothetical protein